MAKNDVVNDILQIEWVMFHTVNGELTVSCQEMPETFARMRSAQYFVWSEELCASYFEDLKEALAALRNLPREKYIYMMADTAPETYEKAKAELPEITDEKKALVRDLWDIIGRQTVDMRKKYPLIALGGRALFAKDALPGDTSIETYQKGEMMTYSEKTLNILFKQVQDMEAEGRSYAFEVQLTTLIAAGYESMEDAERKMAKASGRYTEEEAEAIILKSRDA